MSATTDQLDFLLIRFLLSLSTTQSLRQTANVLGLSQSNASRKLARACEIFGTDLFVRSGQFMKPTAEMNRIRPVLERLLDEQAALFAPEQTFSPADLKRTFRIGLLDHGILAILSPAIGPILREAPGVHIDIVDSKNFTWDALRSDALDMIAYPLADIPGDFDSLELYRCGYSLVVRSGHPLEAVLADKGILSPEDVLPYPKIGLQVTKHLENSDYYNAPVPGLAGQETAISLPYFLAAPFLLSGNDCTLLLPTVSARFMAQTLPISALPTRGLGGPGDFVARLVWHRSSGTDAAHQWLRSMIALHIRESESLNDSIADA